MENALTILAIFAHPDDEIGAGSTLARYCDAGVRVVLVCASRGEAATIYCDECATAENLAQVRTRELECTCAQLGIRELRWLDWTDGGIAALPRPVAIGQIVKLIREIRPDVVLTHPEHGLYPHPDHLAVWELVRDAFAAAADGDEYPEAGAAWAPARLFTRAIPQSFFDAAPAFAQYRVQLNGQQLPFHATPDAEVDVHMRVVAWADRRMAAWDCHRSQHNPNGAFTNVPEAVRRAMAESEHFVLAAARMPLPDGVQDDLLVGLEPSQPQPFGTPAHAADLRGVLTRQRAYLTVCENYGRRVAEPGFRDLLGALATSYREAIHLLAQALRRSGAAVGAIEADPRPVREAARCRGADAQLRFLAAAAEESAATSHSRAAAASGGAASFWRELAAVAEVQQEAIKKFLRG